MSTKRRQTKRKNPSRKGKNSTKIRVLSNGAVTIGGKFASRKAVAAYAKRNPKRTPKPAKLYAQYRPPKKSGSDKGKGKAGGKRKPLSLWQATQSHFAGRDNVNTGINYYGRMKTLHKEYTLDPTIEGLREFMAKFPDKAYNIRIVFRTDKGYEVIRQTETTGDADPELLLEFGEQVFGKYRELDTDGMGRIVEIVDIRVVVWAERSKDWHL